MGVIVNKQQDENDQLTQRINADLRQKMSENTMEIQDLSDNPSEDSDCVKETKKTGKFAWVWIVLIILALISLILIAII